MKPQLFGTVDDSTVAVAERGGTHLERHHLDVIQRVIVAREAQLEGADQD